MSSFACHSSPAKHLITHMKMRWGKALFCHRERSEDADSYFRLHFLTLSHAESSYSHSSHVLATHLNIRSTMAFGDVMFPAQVLASSPTMHLRIRSHVTFSSIIPVRAQLAAIKPSSVSFLLDHYLLTSTAAHATFE
jgi:hypothetical protein